jgi:hypothetical protein
MILKQKCIGRVLFLNHILELKAVVEACIVITLKCITTFSNGCLGSHNDEERSEMRYVMRIAKPRESSRF